MNLSHFAGLLASPQALMRADSERLLQAMVEAAGVEPVISTENTQVTETENA